MVKRFTVYLDACALNRPFDDPTQGRIRLEADAVLVIIDRVEQGLWQLLGSGALNSEVRHARDPDRRTWIQKVLAQAATTVPMTKSEVATRAIFLETKGFGGYDALHIASAEAGGADILLTTDDAMLRLARRYAQELHVRVENPVVWYTEIDHD